jgi:hypothetical protein
MVRENDSDAPVKRNDAITYCALFNSAVETTHLMRLIY